MSSKFARRVARIKTGFLLVLGLVPLRLVQLQWSEAAVLRNHPYNARLEERIEYRGTIYSRERQALALSVGKRRVYPFGALMSHWVGFHHPRGGLAGVEAWKHEILRERRSEDGRQSQPGHSVHLSVAIAAQEQLDRVLPPAPGAAVVVNLNSGQVLAALSRPVFDPLRVTADWPRWQRDPLQPTWNRYALGVYPCQQLWKAWEAEFRSLPRRPALVLDWSGPVQVEPGRWLVSPLAVATVLLQSGSDLPISQLFNAHEKPWLASRRFSRLAWNRRKDGWAWGEVARFRNQVVAWGVFVAPPRACVVLLENSQQAQRAVDIAREALR